MVTELVATSPSVPSGTTVSGVPEGFDETEGALIAVGLSDMLGAPLGTKPLLGRTDGLAEGREPDKTDGPSLGSSLGS